MREKPTPRSQVWPVIKPPADVPFELKDSNDSLVLVSAKIQVSVDKKSGAIAFLKPDGTMITRESVEHPTEMRETSPAGSPTYEFRQTFSLSPGESLYGLGQYNERYMDYRGRACCSCRRTSA
jgi:alpha-D-xyloside xylohydrolase